MLIGSSIYLKDLEWKDALEIKNWGHHHNDLFIDYDLADLSSSELYLWYLFKKKNQSRHYFAIYKLDTNQMCGYLGYKNFRLNERKADLGIVLDPNQLSRGIGQESISLLLDYYFTNLKMNLMSLEVNQFNSRAIHVYKKIGFLKVEEYLMVFENQNIDFENPKYQKYEKYFVNQGSTLYSRVDRMNLYRDEYLRKETYEI